MDTKWCPKCKRHLPRAAFNKNNRAADGLQSWCRECKRDYAADPEHRERANARARDRYAANPEFRERKCARGRARNAADPTVGARCAARLDTPAIRAAVLAALPTMADGRPACPICKIRPAERVEHWHIFATTVEAAEAPGELRGFVCASCNITLSQYESRAHELSNADPAKVLALAGDVVAALRLTAEALESGTPCKPLVARINRKRTVGPFDKTAAGYRRAADYIENPPVRRLMGENDPAIWAAINAAFDMGGNTAKLAAIHCAEAGYRDYAEARGVDVDAAIRHFASRANAPAHAKRQYGQAA